MKYKMLIHLKMKEKYYGNLWWNLMHNWVHLKVTLASPTTYRKNSNIRHTLVGNKIVDHSDVIGASPVGAAPTTSSFST